MLAPDAVNVAVAPEQIVDELNAIVGNVLTVTVTSVVAVQVPIEPIILYTCVVVGLAITLVPVVVFSEVDGLQV